MVLRVWFFLPEFEAAGDGRFWLLAGSERVRVSAALRFILTEASGGVCGCQRLGLYAVYLPPSITGGFYCVCVTGVPCGLMGLFG